MTVKVAAKLTKERQAYNGLDAIQDELVDQPRGIRYAVVAYEVLRHQVEIEEGETIPTIRLTHIEPVRGDHESTVKGILAERYKDRTGKEDIEPEALFDVTSDGQVVPEPSAEEIMAERREEQERREAQDGGEQ